MSLVLTWGRIRRFSGFAAFAAWLVVLGFGFSLLLNEQTHAGTPAHAPARWPASSPLTRDAGRFTLLVFAHPRCSCTRATLRELESVVARSGTRAATYVVFVLPKGAPASWSTSPLIDEARAIPGALVFLDRDGAEATCFDVHTSGQALLYDPAGKLAFEGGLTAGRAHEGDNAGCDAVVADIDGAGPITSHTGVFGCALDQPTRGAR